jgi:hypothetical protein
MADSTTLALQKASNTISDGLFAVAKSIDGLAKAVDRLGMSNADTPMGAVEFLSKQIKDSADQVCHELREVQERQG